jgi:hypothetical protein
VYFQPAPSLIGKSGKMSTQVMFDAHNFSRVTQISEIKIGRAREKPARLLRSLEWWE